MVNKHLIFTTSDQKEFSTEAEARKHEELVEAEKTYKDGLRKFTDALCATFKTKDGYDFKVTSLTTYYNVLPWHNPPRIKEVNFYYWHVSINERDQAEIKLADNEAPNGYWIYRVENLYQKRENAEAELIGAYERWIDEHLSKLHEMKSRQSE